MENSLPRTVITDKYQFPQDFLLNPIYYSIKVIPDDMSLDLLSNQIYGTPDYWDILFYVNNMKDVNALPKSFNTVENTIDNELQNSIQKYPTLLSNQELQTKYKEIIRNVIKRNNETHRRFKIIKKSYIETFIKSIKYHTVEI